MRLLYLTADRHRIGGLARSVARVTEQLRQVDGVEVRVLSLTPEDAPSFVTDVRGLFSGTLPQLWNERVMAACAEDRPDLLVGYYGSQGACAAVTAGLELGIPPIACLRGNDVNLDYFSALHHHQLELAATRAAAVTTVSTEMAGRLRAWFDVDATFIANSVDRDFFRPDAEGAAEFRRAWQIDGPLVGLFGEFKRARGIEILEDLREALAGATTILVGKVRPEAEKWVPDWVRRVPYIEDPVALRAAYCSCDLVLHPSIHDGMPNVVLEAMACGRVVVGSPTGGLIDLLDHGRTGYLCRRDEWGPTIRRLIADPPTLVGAAARQSVPTPGEEADAFLRLFREVLENHGSASGATASPR